MSTKKLQIIGGFPQADFNQTDETKNDYIKNKPELGILASQDEVAKSDLASDVQALLAKADTALQSYTETDPTVPSWAKAATKPTYTATEVGADPSGSATSAVSGHNTATDAHNDIRLLVEGLTTRLNTLADSDDETLDQMSEIVAYIKSNKDLIDSITTNKVNVSDIIDNLTTNVTNKPLSAAQGVALKALIDALQVEVDKKALASDLSSHTGDKSNPHGVTATQVGAATEDHTHNYSELSGTPTIPTKTSELTNDSGYKTTDNDTTYDLAATTMSTNGNVKLNLTAGGSGSGTDSVTIKGSGATTVITDSNGVITISSTNTVYTHPTTSGNKHIPSGGSSGQILRWSANGTAAWGEDNNTTYSVATQTADGLMSSSDKIKLDGIEENQIFVAEYGTTTHDEIFAARESGKTIFCRTNGGSILPLTYSHIDESKFAGHTTDGEREVICSDSDVWSTIDIDIMTPVTAPNRFDVTLSANELFYYANPDTDTLTIGGTFSSLPNGWFGFLTVYAPTPAGVSSSILETTSENGFTLTDIGNMGDFSMAIFKNGASSKLKWYLFKPLPSAEGASF